MNEPDVLCFKAFLTSSPTVQLFNCSYLHFELKIKLCEMVLDTVQFFESPIHLSPLPSDTRQNVTFIGTNLSDLCKIHGKNK